MSLKALELDPVNRLKPDTITRQEQRSIRPFR
jgi:hypothetical protein